MILNIEYHTKRLLLKALNKAGNKTGAAKLTGVSKRTMDRYVIHYNIEYCFKTNTYKIIGFNHEVQDNIAV